jgi:hypothetical protein
VNALQKRNIMSIELFILFNTTLTELTIHTKLKLIEEE